MRGYVSNLRAALGDGVARSAWRDGGYVAEVDADDVDVHRFDRLVERAAALARDGRLFDAVGEVEAARALWRGRPFGGLADEAAVRRRRWLVSRSEPPSWRSWRRMSAWPVARPPSSSRTLTDAVAAQPFRERRRCPAGPGVVPRRTAGRRPALDRGRPLPCCATRSVSTRDRSWCASSTPSSITTRRCCGARRSPTRCRHRRASFVGRRGELDRLAAAAADVGGRGGIVVVSGEAGIGKTALVRAACERLATWPAAWARCVEAAVDTPYGAWSAIAAQLVAPGRDRGGRPGRRRGSRGHSRRHRRVAAPGSEALLRRRRRPAVGRRRHARRARAAGRPPAGHDAARRHGARRRSAPDRRWRASPSCRGGRCASTSAVSPWTTSSSGSPPGPTGPRSLAGSTTVPAATRSSSGRSSP